VKSVRVGVRDGAGPRHHEPAVGATAYALLYGRPGMHKRMWRTGYLHRCGWAQQWAGHGQRIKAK